MFKKLLMGLTLVVAGFCGAAAVQPDDFRITRSATIAAPAEVLFAQVNDLQKWDSWSPWAKLDPNAKHSFEGPAAGVGAIMRWAGNNEVGEGNMTITQSEASSFIQFRLEFLKPMEAVNTSEFTFKPEGDRTTVTWSMYGKNNFIGKAVSLLMNCDKMVGGQFEQGLANLQSIVGKS